MPAAHPVAASIATFQQTMVPVCGAIIWNGGVGLRQWWDGVLQSFIYSTYMGLTIIRSSSLVVSRFQRNATQRTVARNAEDGHADAGHKILEIFGEFHWRVHLFCLHV